MTTYNNNGNLFYVYFVWQDRELWRYLTWDYAKESNRGKPIYLTARLYSITHNSDELIDWVRCDKKPKIGKVKRFMKQILSDKKLQKYRIPYWEWDKLVMENKICGEWE